MAKLIDKEECDMHKNIVPEKAVPKYTPRDNKKEHLREINILLLGEEEVGKSTFINAFANYATYNDLKQAEAKKLIWLIPTKFSVFSDNYENCCTVEIGTTKNDLPTDKNSAKRYNSYVFQVDDVKVRYIDIPGINLTNEYFEILRRYLSQFEELHAICIVIKQDKKLSNLFEQWFKQLLSMMPKHVIEKFVFLFTHSRSTFYAPSDIFLHLKKFLNEICSDLSNVKIPLSKDNVFCVDSEAFRFLAALSFRLSFGKDEMYDFDRSWKKSSEECWRMLKWVAGEELNSLKPCKTKDMILIDRVRQVNECLLEFLSTFGQLVQNNPIVLKQLKNKLKINEDNIKELQNKLYVSVTNVKVEALDQPRLTCTAMKCCEIYQIGEIKQHHYKLVCHEPCLDIKRVPREILGSPELLHCAAMNSEQNCRVCGCSYLMHMHIYYTTILCEDKIIDTEVYAKISEYKSEATEINEIIRETKQKKKEYELEIHEVLQTVAKISYFLHENSITPSDYISKHYEKYLHIDNSDEKLRLFWLGYQFDKEVTEFYEEMLKRYLEEERILNSETVSSSVMNADEILQNLQKLYNVKHIGSELKQQLDKLEDSHAEFVGEAKEMIYPTICKKNIF